MCEDLWGCTHEPETPVTQDGEIIEWRCRCGRRVAAPKTEEAAGLAPAPKKIQGAG